ncbi:MAG: PQQ-dependent sugar dehydrogenase, partial [Pseudomonadota bacterium]
MVRGVLIGAMAVIALMLLRPNLPETIRSGLSGVLADGGSQPETGVLQRLELFSSLYSFTLEAIAAPDDPGIGGAIATLDDTLLFVTREGRFFSLPTAGAEFTPLGFRAPVDIARDGARYETAVQRSSVGVRDLLLRRSGAEGIEVVVSAVEVDADADCVRVAVYRTQLPAEALTGAEGAADWTRIYASRPCIAPADDGYLLQAGGAMAYAPTDGALHIFVGDFGFDRFGRGRPALDPIDGAGDYGRILRLDPATGAAETVSTGHRNPGGLAFAPDGTLWASEHGPMGGDELNRIAPGESHGWPEESFGTQYLTHRWPPDATPGTHAGSHRAPVFAWVPSVAPSGVLVPPVARYPHWEGSILVPTLRSEALRRVRVEGERAVLDERIPVGIRVRDAAFDADGRLWLKADKEEYILRLTPAGREERRRIVEAPMCCDLAAQHPGEGWARRRP